VIVFISQIINAAHMYFLARQ